MTPSTIAATLASHYPTLPPPIERADGGVWYSPSVNVVIDVSATRDGFIATITGADYLRLAHPSAAAEATTPEAAVAAVIQAGDHILAAAALTFAEQATTLATLLGTSFPTDPTAARERVGDLRRIERRLGQAHKAADTALAAALDAHSDAETLATARAAIHGLRGPEHIDRVAILRTLAKNQGWYTVNGTKIRWLAGAGLITARRVIDATNRSGQVTASHTEATITDAGRRAITLLDTTETP